MGKELNTRQQRAGPRLSARSCPLTQPLGSDVGVRSKCVSSQQPHHMLSRTFPATETTTANPPSTGMRADSPQVGEQAHAPKFLYVNCGRSNFGSG